MPKKTRQQKQLTDLRRDKFSITPQPFIFNAAKTSIHPQTTTSPQPAQDYIVKKDLIKTILISTFFITGEIILAVFSNRLGW